MVAHAIEAGSTVQAVIRGCENEGLYRARVSNDSHGQPHDHFWVPAWGPPLPVDEASWTPPS